MNDEKIKIKEKIRTFLMKHDEIESAYIFGSFVNREQYHDIDVAVYLNESFNKSDFVKYPYGYESEMNSELVKLIRNNIDFVVLNKAEITLQHRVINKGILLFSRNDSKRISYENFVRKLYIDAANIRKRKYLSGKITNA